jgi:hypothetical protein
MNILQMMDNVDLCGKDFRSPTWSSWRVFLKALFALRLDAAEFATYQKHTGRSSAPAKPFARAAVIVGRRGGKSRIAALVAVFLAVFREYALAPGEQGVVMVIASDRRQAQVVLKYVKAYFRRPFFARLVANETKDGLELSNNIRVEIHTSDFRAVRGYTIVAAVLDEIAFWATSEESASPDAEIVGAITPGMATIANALLLAISSPYARRGVLWESHQQNFGKDTDELAWQADTRAMNPTVPEKLIAAEYAKDPARAAAEYGAQFRSDVEGLFNLDVLRARVVAGRFELAPASGRDYAAFVDPSGGSSDSFTLAIAHADGDTAVLDLVREVRSPFSPEAVVAEFAADLKRYRISEVTGDAYAGEWPREQFSKRGIEYRVSERNRSEIYLELLPAVMSGGVELLDNPRLVSQLVGLERRVARSGKDSVDHAPGGHDDLANAAAGVLVLVGSGAGAFGALEFAKEELAGAAATVRTAVADAIARAKSQVATGWGSVTRGFRESYAETEAKRALPAGGCQHLDANLVDRVAGGQLRCKQCGEQFWDGPKPPVNYGGNRRSFGGIPGAVDAYGTSPRDVRRK